MPGYLIKAANFVAEISNEEELKHLAGVDTIKKDTLICPLPGKEWIEAKKLPVLRKFWGLDAGTVPPPIQMNMKTPVAPVKTKLPPRLETVVDSIPRFPETEIEKTQENNTHKEDTQTNAGTQRVYQTIASDVIGILEDPSEIMDMHAISRAAESSLTFEIDKVQELTASSHTWHDAAFETASAQEQTPCEGDVQDLDGSILMMEDEDSAEDIQDVTGFFSMESSEPVQEHRSENECHQAGENAPGQNIDETQTQSLNAPNFDGHELNSTPVSAEPSAEIQSIMTSEIMANADDAVKSDAGNAQNIAKSAKLDCLISPPNGSSEPLAKEIQIAGTSENMTDANNIVKSDAEKAQDIAKPAALDSFAALSAVNAESSAETLMANTSNANIMVKSDAETASDTVKPAAPDISVNPADMKSECNKPMTMAQDAYIEAAPHEPTYVIESRVVDSIKEGRLQLDKSLEELSATFEFQNHENNMEPEEDKTSASECAHLSENRPDDVKSETSAKRSEHTNHSWRDSVAAQMFVPESVPEDLMMQIADMMDDEFEPGEKTQVSPSPLHVHTTAARAGNHATPADSTEGIKPYRPTEKSSPLQKHDDEHAQLKGNHGQNDVLPDDSEALHKLEEADTGAWKAHKQAAAAQEIIAGQRFSNSIAQELKAAKAAVEAAKAASEKSEKIDSSFLEPMLHLFDALEEAQTRSHSPQAVQELSEYLKNTASKANKVQEYDVPEDFLDENPSEIFKIRNRKDLLKQLEDSARMERAQKAFEAAPTLKKKPETRYSLKDSLSMIDEESHSDKLKIRGRSELRRMLAAEARAAEMDSVQAMPILSTEDYADAHNSQGQLRSLFEKEGELHLFLANEIKKKSQAELEPVEKEESASPKEHSITDDLPRRNAHAVAVVKPKVAEPTMVTGKPIPKKCPMPTSIHDSFFDDKLVDGESPIAQFDTLFLTTHRIWYIEGNKNHIRVYESHDIENIKWVAKREDKNYFVLVVDGILLAISLVTSHFLPSYQFVFLALAVFFLALAPLLLYIVCFKKTVQIGLSNNMVLKSSIAITTHNHKEAMEFLNRVTAAQHERKQQLKEYR